MPAVFKFLADDGKAASGGPGRPHVGPDGVQGGGGVRGGERAGLLPLGERPEDLVALDLVVQAIPNIGPKYARKGCTSNPTQMYMQLGWEQFCNPRCCRYFSTTSIDLFCSGKKMQNVGGLFFITWVETGPACCPR